MESAKEKAIREAYGEHWNSIKQNVDFDGYISPYNIDITNKMHNNLNLIPADSIHKYRPKSLQGIETNNGWTRIESEADLPNRHSTYEVYNLSYPDRVEMFVGNLLASKGNFTHYKEYKKSQPPIY